MRAALVGIDFGAGDFNASLEELSLLAQSAGAVPITTITAKRSSPDAAYAAATADLSTPRLTRALIEAVEKQEPRRKGSIRPKMRYAHQGGQNPPIIVIHGNALDAVGEPYKRYLEKHFRDTFNLVGTPLRIELRMGKNPFAKGAK